MKNSHVVVVGGGVVGVTLGCVLSRFLNVTVYDRDDQRIQRWLLCSPPFYEPGLAELVDGSSVAFTSSANCLDSADIVILCINYSVESDLRDTLHLISSECTTKSHRIIVDKSTLPLNTSQRIKHFFNNHHSHFDILSIPEFLSQGTAIRDCLSPSRVLIGCDTSESGIAAQNTLIDVYAQWVPRSKILTQNIWSTELSKLASNALLAQRISSINSFTAICDATNANIGQLTQSLATDTRIGSDYLHPSVGFGGSCFEKDLKMLIYLCESLDLVLVAEYWKGVLAMNDYQLQRFVRRVQDTINGVEHPHVAVLGLSFKKDTGDVRLSPSVRIIKDLLAQHNTVRFTVCDPAVTEMQTMNEFDGCKRVHYCHGIAEAVNQSHCLLLLTNWPEYHTQIDWTAVYDSMHEPRWVLDGHSIVDVEKLISLGFNVYQVGH
ncbi:hypothetical protein E3P99_00466 [Wallemia hederae]|uniref:UDP-glucose 6-dehydrogenase n=1 Tax=Wallemia hederae TaxID=1540922 RepID=A0A4T0FVG6_9BASI|nr:hypothetical protein E3P99_00466 [Wallemia hederae]